MGGFETKEPQMSFTYLILYIHIYIYIFMYIYIYIYILHVYTAAVAISTPICLKLSYNTAISDYTGGALPKSHLQLLKSCQASRRRASDERSIG